MSKIALVTDSTTYMPPELVRKYNISVAPQVLIWGDQTYKDGVDIEDCQGDAIDLTSCRGFIPGDISRLRGKRL